MLPDLMFFQTLVEFLAAADIAPEPTDGFSKFKLLLEAERFCTTSIELIFKFLS